MHTGIFNGSTEITIPIEIDGTSFGSFTAEWDVKDAIDKLGKNDLLYSTKK